MALSARHRLALRLPAGHGAATAWVFVAPPFNSNSVPRQGEARAWPWPSPLFIAPHFPPVPDAVELGGVHPRRPVPGGHRPGHGLRRAGCSSRPSRPPAPSSTSPAGFSAASTYDPFSNASSTPFGRFYQLLATDDPLRHRRPRHHRAGASSRASTSRATAAAPASSRSGRILAHDLSTFFAAALQMAVPLVAALFLAEVALGLVAKAVPQMNIISLSLRREDGRRAAARRASPSRPCPPCCTRWCTQAADTMIAMGSA